MEGKLADTASNRPLALTVGAAAVTLLVILAVLAGPSVVSCFNSSDGMGQCLRGRMVEVGLIPAPPAPALADAEGPVEAAAEQVAVVSPVEPEEAPAITPEPELDVTPPAPIDTDTVDATFGLLRAEPDGSVVIAGSGTPGSEVELFADGASLGSTTVEPSGDWVFVPEAPLAPGGLEITLSETGKESVAAESFIVVIDEDRQTQPLVVASTPGQASEVLQGLASEDLEVADLPEEQVVTGAETPEPAPVPVEPAPAAVAADAPVADAPDAITEPATPAEAEAATDTAALPEQPTPVDTPSVPAAEEGPTAVAVNPPSTAPKPEPSIPAAPEEPAVTELTSPSVATEETAPEAPAVPAQPPVAATDPATDAPAVPPTPPLEPEPAVADRPTLVPPTIDAIEKEGDRTFFAGAGPEGGTIRLYVDDAFVADTTVSDGRWLVESGPVLEEESQRVRADLLAEGSADVESRAEVNFVVETPVSEPAIADAGEEAIAPAPPVATEDDVVADPAEAPLPAETSPTQAEQPVLADAAELPANTAPLSAPAEEIATPDTAPAAPDALAAAPSVATPPAIAPAAPSTPEPAPIVTAEQPAPPASEPATPSVTETTPAVVAEQPAQPTTPVAPVATPEPEVPTMVAVSFGDPEAERFVSGKAIIRRGDNLWTIARRVYGQGVRYTTIYNANTGQIRDPDRIYPGQVFDLPEDQ